MSRYIDADKAIKALTGWETDPTDEDIEYTINHIPTEDVVPVVRCKDCKHGTGWNKAPDGTVLGECNYIYIGIEQMDFCRCGERKE